MGRTEHNLKDIAQVLLAAIGSANWELIETPIPPYYIVPKYPSSKHPGHRSTVPTANTHPGLTTSPGRANVSHLQQFYHLLQ